MLRQQKKIHKNNQLLHCGTLAGINPKSRLFKLCVSLRLEFIIFLL